MSNLLFAVAMFPHKLIGIVEVINYTNRFFEAFLKWAFAIIDDKDIPSCILSYMISNIMYKYQSYELQIIIMTLNKTQSALKIRFWYKGKWVKTQRQLQMSIHEMFGKNAIYKHTRLHNNLVLCCFVIWNIQMRLHVHIEFLRATHTHRKHDSDIKW